MHCLYGCSAERRPGAHPAVVVRPAPRGTPTKLHADRCSGLHPSFSYCSSGSGIADATLLRRKVSAQHNSRLRTG